VRRKRQELVSSSLPVQTPCDSGALDGQVEYFRIHCYSMTTSIRALSEPVLKFCAPGTVADVFSAYSDASSRTDGP
jgi:hypothetical protein